MGKWVEWGKLNADNLFHFHGLINLWPYVLSCSTTDAGTDNKWTTIKKEERK